MPTDDEFDAMLDGYTVAQLGGLQRTLTPESNILCDMLVEIRGNLRTRREVNEVARWRRANPGARLQTNEEIRQAAIDSIKATLDA